MRVFWQYKTEIIWQMAALLVVTALSVVLQTEDRLIVIASLVLVALLAGWLWLALTRPVWLVAILICYLTLEAVVIRFLGVNRTIIIGLQVAGELLVYATFVIVLSKRIIGQRSIRNSPILAPLVLILIVIVASMTINMTPFVAGIVNVRAFLRFVFLYLLVINLDISKKQLTILPRIILFLGLLEAALGLLQRFTGGTLNQYLLPRVADLQVAGYAQQFRLLTRGREIGSIFGTLGDTVYFGLFMLVVLALILGDTRRYTVFRGLVIGGLLILIAYSFARAVTIAALLLLGIHLVVNWGRVRSARNMMFMAPIVTSMLLLLLIGFRGSESYLNPVRHRQNVIQNLTGIFSERYVEIARKQRLGALLGVTPTVLVNRPILGYGPDTFTVVAELNESDVNLLLGPLIREGFEDVYWVALLAYYGLLGVLAVGFLFFRMIRSAYFVYHWGKDPLTKRLALASLYLAMITPFLMFFAQVLEFRNYSALFWLMPALMLQQYRQEKSRRELVM